MKKVIKLAGIAVGIGLVFIAGVASGDGLTWKQHAVNNAHNKYVDTAGATTEALTTDVQADITTAIDTKLTVTVEDNQAELQRLLEEYYQMQINELTNTEEFILLEAEIERIMEIVLKDYKVHIDSAIDKALNGE